MQVQPWRLSLFYFAYFASLGALIPYWTLYLDSLHFSSLEIGQLMATLAISKVVAPYLWGWVADRSGYHVRVVQITSILSVLCFLPLLWFDHFWSMLGFMLLFSFFWNASLPQFEVVTLGHLGKARFRYSKIRLWGSLGFIASVILLGALFQQIAIDALPLVLLVIFTSIYLSSLLVPEFQRQHHPAASIWPVLRQPQVIALLLGCFFLQASHGVYYTFFSLYMETLGYARLDIGLLWSLGVLAEVVLFYFMHRLLQLRSASDWFTLAMLLTALRWLLMAFFADTLWVVLIIQCLHAASFGMYHAAAIHLIQDYFPHHKGRGQALYAAFSFGAGGALGSLMAGLLWDVTSPTTTFMIAAVLALMGWVVSLRVREATAP